MIRYSCPWCHTALEAPDPQGDTATDCPTCGRGLRVPPAAVLPAEAPSPAEAVRPRLDTVSALPPRPALGPRTRGGSDLGGRPGVPAPPAHRRGWVLVAAIVGLLLGGYLCLGGVAVVVGSLIRLPESYTAQSVPQETRLASLLAGWPPTNRNVVLTDFACGGPLYITSSNPGESGIWVPVYPAGQARGPAVPAMLHGSDDREEEVLRLCRQGRVQGLASRGVSLGVTGSKLVSKNHPGTNLPTCLRIEVGEGPTAPAFLYRLIGAGAAAILVGAVVGVVSLYFLAPDVLRAVRGLILSPSRRR